MLGLFCLAGWLAGCFSFCLRLCHRHDHYHQPSLFSPPLRPSVPTTALKITEVASKIGDLWKGLSEADKGKYKAQAERLKVAAGAVRGVF